MARREALVALLLAAALAGCIGSGDEPSPLELGGGRDTNATTAPTGAGATDDVVDVPATEAEPQVPATIAYSGCHEYHVFYPTEWSVWEAMVPDGFGPDGSDPAGLTTTLYQHVSLCTSSRVDPEGVGTPSQVAWMGLIVTPPAELSKDGSVLHALAVDLITDNPALAGVYAAWGLGDLTRDGAATVSQAGHDGVGWAGTVQITADAATYTLAYQVGPPSVGNVSGAARVFITQDRAVTGWFDYAWPGWTDMGLGTFAFTQQGDPEAPAAYAGNIHQVDDVSLQVTYGPWPRVSSPEAS